MKAAEYPDFDKIRDHSDESEIALLRKLIWLDAHDVVAFGSYDESKQTWDQGAYPFVNVNDTFHYGSADWESLEEEDIDAIIPLYKSFGHHGVTAWAAKKRGMEPLGGLRTPEYHRARQLIGGEVLMSMPDPLKEFKDLPAPSDLLCEIRRLKRLIWLASRDRLCFSDKDEWNEGGETDEGAHCFGNVYAFSIHASVDEKTVDLLFDLYETFGRSGMDAWESFVNPEEEAFLRSLSQGTQGNLMLTEEYENALAYLKENAREA